MLARNEQLDVIAADTGLSVEQIMLLKTEESEKI